MSRSATDTVQDIINAAVVDAIVALKDASKGLPNALLRDLNAIHANTAFADLPETVRLTVASSARDAFVRLRKEGYVVAETKSLQVTSVGREPRSPIGRPSEKLRGSAPSHSPKRRPRPTS